MTRRSEQDKSAASSQVKENDRWIVVYVWHAFELRRRRGRHRRYWLTCIPTAFVVNPSGTTFTSPTSFSLIFFMCTLCCFVNAFSSSIANRLNRVSFRFCNWKKKYVWVCGASEWLSEFLLIRNFITTSARNFNWFSARLTRVRTREIWDDLSWQRGATTYLLRVTPRVPLAIN